MDEELDEITSPGLLKGSSFSRKQNFKNPLVCNKGKALNGRSLKQEDIDLHLKQFDFESFNLKTKSVPQKSRSSQIILNPVDYVDKALGKD